MKKLIVLFSVLLMFSFGFGATGWFNDYILFNVNGNGEAWYWIGSDPSFGTELDGTNFGAVSSLTITGTDMKYWSDSQDRTGGAFYWQIKDTDGNLINSGADPYDANEVIWSHNAIGGNDFQGLWGSQNTPTDSPINILTDLEDATTYQLHIWAKSWGTGQGDSYLSNSSANYVATFTTPDGEVPITLASFTAEVLNGTVKVDWITESETENSHFLVYRDGDVIASIPGHGTCTEPHDYVYTDATVQPGVHEYVLADVTWGGEVTEHAPVNVEVESGESSVEDFVLNKAYPNPFNPSVTINYQLSTINTVSASIYNTNGDIIKSILNEEMNAGSHTLTWNAEGNPSGIFILKMLVGDVMQTQKLVLMK